MIYQNNVHQTAFSCTFSLPKSCIYQEKKFDEIPFCKKKMIFTMFDNPVNVSTTNNLP